jgi:hypothetical protein
LPLTGDPEARDMLVVMQNDFGFEAPNEGIENGFRSWGGDGTKHSSRVVVDPFVNAS